LEPREDPSYLGQLPEATSDAHVALLVKRYEYISVVLRPQAEGRHENAVVLTLHQNEAKKLAAALLDIVASPVREDFVDESWHGTEGVYLGGPPRRDQLVEFNPNLLRRGRSDEA
jgi:hypothetical protein